jgi:hypothetical protein
MIGEEGQPVSVGPHLGRTSWSLAVGNLDEAQIDKLAERGRNLAFFDARPSGQLFVRYAQAPVLRAGVRQVFAHQAKEHAHGREPKGV